MTPGAESWEEIRERGEDLLDERFLNRLLQAEKPPLWILLEAAEHFFHAENLPRAQAFLNRGAKTGYGDPLADELQAKIVWLSGDHSTGLRLAREAAAKWEMATFLSLIEAMETDDRVEIMEPVWRTELYHDEDRSDYLITVRLRLSGEALVPSVVVSSLGVVADWAEPGVWALEALGSGHDTGTLVQPLLERMAGWPAGMSLKNIPGVELAVLEVMVIGRSDTGTKNAVSCVLEPGLLQRLGELGVAVKMLG